MKISVALPQCIPNETELSVHVHDVFSVVEILVKLSVVLREEMNLACGSLQYEDEQL